METTTTSPTETRQDLERSVTYNYNAYKKAQGQDVDGSHKELIETFENRFNRPLEIIFDEIKFLAKQAVGYERAC